MYLRDLILSALQVRELRDCENRNVCVQDLRNLKRGLESKVISTTGLCTSSQFTFVQIHTYGDYITVDLAHEGEA